MLDIAAGSLPLGSGLGLPLGTPASPAPPWGGLCLPTSLERTSTSGHLGSGSAGLSGGNPSVRSLLPGPLREDPSSRAARGSGLRPAPLVPLVHAARRSVRTSGASHPLTSPPRAPREGAQLLVLQPWAQHARAGPPGRPLPHPHQRDAGPRVLPRPGDADVRLPGLPWGVGGPGQPPRAQDLTGTPASHPLPPALSQSAWKTHTSSTSTRSGSGSSPKALTKST